jgi:arylsulfatase A-like enzyme
VSVAAVAATMLVAACGRHAAAPRARPPTDRVVLITIDTLRADHVGARREGVALTPCLDALATQAVSFDDAITNGTLTRPAHASMLTGLYAWRHGVANNLTNLTKDVVTLGEWLQPRGFATTAVVSSVVLHPLWRGFGTFLEPVDLPERSEASPELTMRTARNWLEHHRSERFFLFVHFFPPHGPYSPPERFRLPHEPKEGRRLRLSQAQFVPGTIPVYQRLGDERDPGLYRARYAAHVRYVDSQVGALLGALRDLGLYDRAAIIVTADHGESLGERGFYFDHGNVVYREQSAVPLLLKLPGAERGGTRSRAPVESVDVFPTVLQLLGEPVPEYIDGRSLLRALGPDAQAKRLRFSLSADAKLVAVLATPWKLIVHSGEVSELAADRPRVELFRLDRDPGETTDLASKQPTLASGLYDEIRRRSRPFPAPAPISPETERALRALGYVR